MSHITLATAIHEVTPGARVAAIVSLELSVQVLLSSLSQAGLLLALRIVDHRPMPVMDQTLLIRTVALSSLFKAKPLFELEMALISIPVPGR